MKRGHWRAAKRAARLEKAGRLNDARRELSAAQHAHDFDCKRLFEKCFASGRTLPALAMRPRPLSWPSSPEDEHPGKSGFGSTEPRLAHLFGCARRQRAAA
ncbi:unnamed protein product [Prorocentrum cordatum]|nr:unnamed protein product [Polarella glacialis]